MPVRPTPTPPQPSRDLLSPPASEHLHSSLSRPPPPNNNSQPASRLALIPTTAVLSSACSSIGVLIQQATPPYTLLNTDHIVYDRSRTLIRSLIEGHRLAEQVDVASGANHTIPSTPSRATCTMCDFTKNYYIYTSCTDPAPRQMAAASSPVPWDPMNATSSSPKAARYAAGEAERPGPYRPPYGRHPSPTSAWDHRQMPL
ncbi:Uncharacterized protein TCAP_04381 [Tolypocladium capitatum]|uniref:Uncharacterized protein n=1 Tax=Tolypocladium capitatum TaxID=45235 RepID=A0A2K3QDS1_9HYPO|nr:Uncharacterized protein TCAP_04381 [Tolypocladium capitatum]